jgi:hypothetical protein
MMAKRIVRRWVARVLIVCGFLAVSQSFGQQPADALDSLTAPIALYPDALVAQILVASTNVEALQKFSDWVGANSSLKGSELQDAAAAAGFDACYVALAAFPQVIQMMVQKLDWTTKLGQAFTTNKDSVFDSIQRLRAKAQEAGNLKTTPQQQVENQTTSSGEQVIVIQPANPQVVYVPQYNTQTVYAPAPPSAATGVAAAAIGFTAGIIVGASSSHYYGPYGWHGGSLYEEAWEDRYDYLEDRREDVMDYREDRREDLQENAPERREAAQENQAQRQTSRQETQGQRQTTRQESQAQRQTSRQETQGQRQSTMQGMQAQGQANPGGRQASASGARSNTLGQQTQRSGAAATSSYGGQTASQRSGTRSGGFSGYQSGAATRAERSRGSSSLSSSRGGGGGGGGRRRR